MAKNRSINASRVPSIRETGYPSILPAAAATAIKMTYAGRAAKKESKRFITSRE